MVKLSDETATKYDADDDSKQQKMSDEHMKKSIDNIVSSTPSTSTATVTDDIPIDPAVVAPQPSTTAVAAAAAAVATAPTVLTKAPTSTNVRHISPLPPPSHHHVLAAGPNIMLTGAPPPQQQHQKIKMQPPQQPTNASYVRAYPLQQPPPQHQPMPPHMHALGCPGAGGGGVVGSGGGGGGGVVLTQHQQQQPPPPTMHHISHHHQWPIVDPVFHFGPGFEHQHYCPTHSQGPQPAHEHVVFFHVNMGVSVTFQINGNREIIRGKWFFFSSFSISLSLAHPVVF